MWDFTEEIRTNIYPPQIGHKWHTKVRIPPKSILVSHVVYWTCRSICERFFIGTRIARRQQPSWKAHPAVGDSSYSAVRSSLYCIREAQQVWEFPLLSYPYFYSLGEGEVCESGKFQVLTETCVLFSSYGAVLLCSLLPFLFFLCVVHIMQLDPIHFPPLYIHPLSLQPQKKKI